MSQVLQVNGDYLVKVSDGGNITLDTGSTGEVRVIGNLVVDQNLTVGGNLILGNASDDEIQINSKITSDLIPYPEGFHNLGSDRYHWGAVYTSQVLPQLGGNLTVKGLVDPIDGRDAATKDYVDSVLGRVDNVYYVATSGNDLNDGRSLSKAKRTIKAAVAEAVASPTKGYDTTIFIKSGDYIEDNPIRLPPKLALWGDSLRTTTVRPLNKTQDLFWVTNGSYITNITMKDHEFPSAAVAFPPPTEEYPAVSIFQSPYVWNCTSITTTGCGMRVDGAYTTGLKSMVLDSYTQYNQGGIGIHMLNRGNTQLVSAFTINCDIAILCTDGGFCSLTNSNASFGNYGLVSDGVSEPLYSGILQGSPLGIIGDTITINNLVERPNVGDAVSFGGSTNYYTVTIAQPLTAGGVDIAGPDFSNQPSDARALRQIGLASKEKVQIDTIDYVNETFKGLSYNQFKCTRDTGLIIDAALDDMLLGTNYKSIQAGLSYSRVSAAEVRSEAQLAPSLAALTFTKNQILEAISSDSTTEQPEYVTVDTNFNLIANLFANASSTNPPTPPAYVFTPPVGAEQGKINARDIILANRNFLIQEGIAYIEQNLTFNYDRETCQRDVGLVIDAVGYDLMFSSNFRSITAGRSYWRAQASTVVGAQKTATIDAFTYLKGLLQDFVISDSEAYDSVTSNMDLIIDIVDQGLTAVPPTYTIPNPTGYDLGYQNARNLIEDNRDFIKAEVLYYIGNTYPSFVYDQTACQRDIDLILDAIYYDMTYGGNLETLVAGNAYFSAGTIVNPGEETETLDAYNFMKSLIIDVAKNVDVVELQVDVPQVTGTPGSTEAANFAGSLVEDVRTIIAQSPYPEIRNPDLRWVSPIKVSFYELFRDEKDDSARLVTNYIDSRYFLLDYDRAICQRDIGLIVDAIAYDLMFGSNFKTITAGRAYARGTASVVNTVQKTATIDAFNKLKTLVVALVEDTETTIYADTVSNLMDIILNILGEGVSAVPSYVITNPTGYSVNYQRARDLIEANRNFILAEVIQFIEDNFSTITYDSAKCSRDVGLIIDAIRYDMMFGSNFRSISAGRAYYRANALEVTGSQKTATLAALNQLKIKLSAIVSGDATALTSITDNMNLIIDIFNNGLSAVPGSYTIPNPTGYDSGFQNARNLIESNRAFIKAEVIEYIRVNYVVPFGFTYNTAKCQRDIDLILDAVYYDMTYGGNLETVVSALAYYVGTTLQLGTGEANETYDAFGKLKQLIGEIALNTNVTELQSAVSQTFGTAGSPAASTFASNLIESIRVYINGGAAPTVVAPVITWVASELTTRNTALVSNKATVQTQIIDYIDQNFALVYDQTACRRDVGYILDAVRYDMTYGGNQESLIAGRAYYSFGNIVNPGEELATIGTYTYMASIIESIAQNISIAPLQGTVTQVSGTGSDSATALVASGLINDIITLITGVEPTSTMPSTAWVDSYVVAKAGVLLTNKENLKTQVTDFIDSTYNTNASQFTYDADKCKRDVGLIVDALSWDLAFNSNFRSITAGRSYARGNASIVSDRQKQATIEAYEILRDYVVNLVSENVAAVESVTSNMNMIVDIFDQGLTAVPDYRIPNPVGYSDQLSRARNLVESNREFIVAEVIRYISDQQQSSLNYDKDKCQRDVGLIIDAIGYDMMFKSNFRSITAGRAYYRANASVVTGVQKAATIDAFTYLKTLLVTIVDGNTIAETSVSTNMDIIINILTNGLGVVPSYVLTEPTGYDVNYKNARNLIEANRAFIKAEVVKYIEVNYNSVYLTFDQAACERDIGYILDAVRYDMTYGGNLESLVAANAYYVGSVLQLGTGEKTATLAAYDYMKTIVGLIAQNQDVTELQAVVTQVTGTGGNAASATAAQSLVEVIRDVITDNIAPATVLPSTTWVDVGLAQRYTLLQNNKEEVQVQVTDYVDNYYPFSYDRETCQRDVGLVIDAVGYDMMFNSNFRSVTAGRAYYRSGASVVSTIQKSATIDAFTYLKDLMINTVSANAVALSRVTTCMDLIINIITNGLSAVPVSYTITDPTGYDVNYKNARDLIEANRAFIKAEVDKYIEVNYNSVYLTFDKAACQRDIGYILDAVRYDMTYGGNLESLVAGNAYYSNAVLQLGTGEKAATLAAYTYLRDLVTAIAQNQDVVELQTAVLQVTGTPGSATAANAAGALVGIVSDIITDNVGPAAVAPSTTWVSSTLVTQNTNLQSKKSLIQGQVTTYIDNEYVNPGYNKDKCERDIRYILDAVYYDMTYGGNMETAVAANSYFVGTNVMIPGEVEATLDAYAYMRDIMYSIAQNIAISPRQTDIQQIFGFGSGTAAAQTAADLIDDIRSVIDTGTLITTPSLASTAWVSESTMDQFDILQQDKENIKIAVADYIDSTYFLLTYNREKCKRDIGYMIDAIGYDVMFASNFRSISAARSYYRSTANRVVAAQKSATIGALRRLKELSIITAAGNAIAEQRIKDSVELMVDIVNRGLVAVPEFVTPNPSGYPSTTNNARELVESNRAFIKAEVIEYIRQQYVVPSSFVYDAAKCERDIDLILDAIYYDITYGGNLESLVAARAYYVGTDLVNETEKTETLAAFAFMRIIVSQIAQNVSVTPLQTVVTQVFGSPGSIGAATAISNLIGNIIDYIDDPELPPTEIIPSIAWVNPAYATTHNNLQLSKESIKTQVQSYIDTKYAYNQATCARDIGYVLDASIYDILYGGNSQTIAAAETYYSAGTFQIGARERLMTVNTFKYLKGVLGSCLLNIAVTPINTVATQNISLPEATVNEVIVSNQLFANIAEIIENGFTSVITLNENIPDFDPQYPNTNVTFHQYSLITASGQTFEWVGAGTNVNTSLPYLGGIPISENKAVETNGGKVYWTGTDQFGDFNIGGELVIRRDTGTIEGRTFTKSLFAVLTPYILAVGE